jgi:DNA polymerase-3 subunit beta
MKKINTIKKAFSALAPKSSVLPILECVLVIGNRLIITDLNTSVIVKDIDIPLDFVLEGKDFIKACGYVDNAKFEKKEQRITISNEDESFTFYSENVGDFPKVEYPDAISVGKLPASDVAHIMRASTVISKDELRPAMMCVAIKDGYIMGTDAHSAIYEKSEFGCSKPILLGKKAVKLVGLFPKSDWVVLLSDQKVVLENDDIIIIQRVDDNRFPDLMAVIPKELSIGMTVNKTDFKSAVTRALLCAPKTLYSVTLEVNSRLTVSSEDVMTNNAYKRQLSCKHTGDTITVPLNGRMLLNLINGIKADELTFGMYNQDRCVVINGSSLLMPVKSNNY